MGTKADEQAAIAAIVKGANFCDLIGQIWKAIQADQSPTLPLQVLADALIDRGHVYAGLGVLGILESGRSVIEISDLQTVGLAPRTGEKHPGRQLRITAIMRPPSKPDDEDDEDGRWPVNKTR